MKTLYETVITLNTGRCVKIFVAENKIDAIIELKILVKDPSDNSFRPLIGKSHPLYWKLKKLNSPKSKLLELSYSGIDKKQIQKIIKEFQINFRNGGFNFNAISDIVKAS
ncbi:hypothetical protein ACFP1I_20915 [Dyadobacter subterraneus]|uniref:Uncharacterized protein n=1 Tax=Dyadobacter subterraneus TaxID=2773304 RepID=A0ABR9W754_9BACT|nr:hypothetical protein [Dyadobacter subterraneus]MBE9461294.1 hypothetical protein [Dyadobacter subterraneus]